MLFLSARSTTRNVSAQTVLDPARLVGAKAVCIETFGVLHLSLQTQHTGHPRPQNTPSNTREEVLLPCIGGAKARSLDRGSPSPKTPRVAPPPWPEQCLGARALRLPWALPKGPLAFAGDFCDTDFWWPPLTPPQKIAIDRQRRKRKLT